MVRFAFAAVLLSLSATATAAPAIGPVYPIAEPDLLAAIEAKLREAERSGAIERWRAEWRERVGRAIGEPAPADELGVAREARTSWFDPTIEVPYEVTDADGRVIHAAGTRVNPLDNVRLSRPLLFFDARDPRQVTLARATIERLDGRVKPILTGGSYLDLMRAWKLRVWYDQRGVLTRELGISRVPARVSQDGRRRRIDELPAQEGS